MIALAMPTVGGEVEVLPRDRSNEQTPGAFGRPVYRGKHRPAGNKLWRKAKRGKL
jgi:hypothetical protein